MKYQKKIKQGFSERKKVLLKAYSNANDIIKCALSAAITARISVKGLISIPQTPEFDSKGLGMNMVYYVP